jgi:hypothetical protein
MLINFVIDNSLNFILFFSINDIRWQSVIHRAVDGVFFDRGKQGCMEYQVNVPRCRKAYLKCHRIDNMLHFEGSITLWG